jgi:hypothetical protein
VTSGLNIHVAELLYELSHVRVFVFVMGFVDGLYFYDQVFYLFDDVLGLLVFELQLLLVTHVWGA